MSNNSFFFVIKNFILAFLIIVLLIIGLFVWLERYTLHGIETEVPNVVGLQAEEAELLAQNRQLRLVITDSTYSNKCPMGSVVEQMPPANSHAKPGRDLFVVINARCKRIVRIPDIHDLSPRQAESMLNLIGILVDSTYTYIPSEFPDLVLDVTQNGQSLALGEEVYEGSKVTLVVGAGPGNQMMIIPNLVGKTRAEARSLLLSSRLTVGGEYFDDDSADNKDAQIVYQQTPEAGQKMQEGGQVNIKLSADEEKALNGSNQENEDDFF